ncbi:lytic polysaccharide monooxygenase [Apiospora rasikravindrae]|uniref:lytic cellulose monooxygenase (C4-dehydrogenating) n=1 Tax=Apiospora rasikravindrae TaxID=990691 RepID=A0ABR1S2C4_9PEZI
MRTTALLGLAATASLTSAHTIFVQLESGGTMYPVSHGIRTPSYDGPIQDVSSDSLACNGPPNPTTPSDKIIDVQAGSTVTAVWRHTLTSGSDDVMDASHKGPTLAYLKKVDSATAAAGPGNGWFKIQQDGLNGGVWGTSKVIENGGLHSIKIPDCLADGQYLLRAEMIALHAAGSSGGAQLYMECAQINIKGGKATASPQTYSIPGIYKANDPGLLVNIYSMGSSSYVIPGTPSLTFTTQSPIVLTPSPAAPAAATPEPATLRPLPRKPPRPPSSRPPRRQLLQPRRVPGRGGGCSPVAQWGQCGGKDFKGCTACSGSYKCVVSNEYYSQCQ